MIPVRSARTKGYQIINKYTSFVATLKHLGIKVRSRMNLYGYGWIQNNKIQRGRLRIQTYGLDGLYGFYVPPSDGVRHHISYDKSQTEDDYLLYVHTYINRYKIPRPPTQNYFGEPIQYSPTTLLWEMYGRVAKEAFKRGEHNPLWLNPNTPFYHPNAVSRFYWNKLQVSKYDEQWLSSPLAKFSPPPWFLSYLNSNPLNIQPP